MPLFIPKGRFTGPAAPPPPPMVTEEQIREIIGKADANGDGCLSKEELKKALKELGSRMAAWRAYRCLQKVDTNHDGQLNGAEIDMLVNYILARYAGKPKKK